MSSNRCLYCGASERTVRLEFRTNDAGDTVWYQCWDQPLCVSREQTDEHAAGVQTFEYQRFLQAMQG